MPIKDGNFDRAVITDQSSQKEKVGNRKNGRLTSLSLSRLHVVEFELSTGACIPSGKGY